jgi:hypothetical protein
VFLETLESDMTDTVRGGLPEIAKLDLARIHAKLTDPTGEFAWSKDKADLAIAEYRDFLRLIFSHPRERLVPGPGVDEVWHLHVLDTRKYAADCRLVFGYFVHHIPSYADESASDPNARARTVALYQKVFNRTPDLSTCGACCCGEAVGELADQEAALALV